MGRQRADALDRPPGDALPAHARRQPLVVPRLRRESTVGQWQHLAASFDGTTARYYINGVEVASRTVSGPSAPRTPGASAPTAALPAASSTALIDEIRVYDRALSATEIQADMTSRSGIADPGAPTTPGNLAVTGSTSTSISLGWTASTDDTGVAGYTVYADGAVGGTTHGDLVHGHRPHLLDGPSARGGGVRRSREHVAARLRQRLDDVLRRSRLGSSPRTRSRRDRALARRRLRQRQEPDDQRRVLGDRAATAAALSFDGIDDHVALGPLGTFYNAAFTLEAWVQKTTRQEGRRNRRYAGPAAARCSGSTIWPATTTSRSAAASPPTSIRARARPSAQWQHLAATFDGTTARYYVNGV